MSVANQAAERIAERAKAIYKRDVRKHVDPRHKGKLLALDVESGDFEIDSGSADAVERLKARRPDAVVFVLRIGHPTAFRLGGWARIKRR